MTGKRWQCDPERINALVGTVMLRFRHLNSSSDTTGSGSPPVTSTEPLSCGARGPKAVASNGEGSFCSFLLCFHRWLIDAYGIPLKDTSLPVLIPYSLELNDATS